MKATDKREVAEACLNAALKGDFKRASKIRQEAYLLNPPGTIGIDWSDKKAIWNMDKKFLQQMDIEPFTDLENTKPYIQSLKAGLFIDHIFNFRDNWAVAQRESIGMEKLNCPQLEHFLQKTGFDLPSVSRLHIYAQTKHKNINAKIHLDARSKTGLEMAWEPQHFPAGEYDLGFSPGTPLKIIEGRRKWLEDTAQFDEMRASGISGFPKTFQTFQKHKFANSAKYQAWVEEHKKGNDVIQ